MELENHLVKALVKAQAEMPNPHLNKETVKKYQDKNGAWKEQRYKYADITETLRVIKPALNKNGLCVVQTTGLIQDTYCLITTLLHESGEKLESYYPLKTFEKMQDEGSALTYAKRYALCAMLAVSGEEDDDAQDVKGVTNVQRSKETIKPSTETRSANLGSSKSQPTSPGHATGVASGAGSSGSGTIPFDKRAIEIIPSGVYAGRSFLNAVDIEKETGWKNTKKMYQAVADHEAPAWVQNFLDYVEALGWDPINL